MASSRVLPPHLPRLKLGTSGACHGALCASLGLFCPSHPGPSRLGQTGVANAYDRTCKHGHAVAARWIALPHTPILCQAGLLAALLACWGQGPLSRVGILHTLGDNDSLGRDLSRKQQGMLTGHRVELWGRGSCPPLPSPRLLAILSHQSFSSSALWPTTIKPSRIPVLSCPVWVIHHFMTKL